MEFQGLYNTSAGYLYRGGRLLVSNGDPPQAQEPVGYGTCYSTDQCVGMPSCRASRTRCYRMSDGVAKQTGSEAGPGTPANYYYRGTSFPKAICILKF